NLAQTTTSSPTVFIYFAPLHPIIFISTLHILSPQIYHSSEDMSLVVFNGSLLAVGGSDGITNLKTIEVYNHDSNTWRYVLGSYFSE
ncbi:unnamed protein product, partial [Oncorhynchus mykiss]